MPVPKTKIVRTGIDLTPLCDGLIPDGLCGFLAEINVAIGRLTDNASPPPPVFLRTGQGSGKHDWRNTCYLDLAAGDTIPNHVAALVKWSHLVDIFGLPTDVWVVREFLSLQAKFRAMSYGGMPVAREYRAFMVGGRLQCLHPYWPYDAVAQGKPDVSDWRDEWARISEMSPALWNLVRRLVGRIAPHFDGAGDWSIDICPTTDGQWYVTDMAVAGDSFHWTACKFHGNS